MEKDFLLPDVGEGLEEATIVDWLVEIGDRVTVNQPLCVIETAKAEVELPSPYEGQVVARRGELGEELKVGELLVRIDTSDAAGTGAGPGGSPVRADQGRNPVLVGYGVSESSAAPRQARDWSQAADGRAPAEAAPADVRAPAEAAPADVRAPAEAAPADVRAPAEAASVTTALSASGLSLADARPLAKPPVRKLARDLGVDLARVTPRGPRGDVLRDDVRRAATAATPAGNGSALLAAPAGDELIPVRGIRARIAQRMALSRSSIPEATCGIDVDCSELLRLRNVLREASDPDRARTLTPFVLVVWMVPRALRAAPLLNSTFDADEQVIRVSRAVHIGLATSTDQGLLAPVLRDAHLATLTEIAGGIARLAEGGRQGTLTPAELTGSTFTITNYGALGLDDGNPVINYPEAAILGVGAIKEKPVAVGGQVVVRPQTKLICAFDHRVCDGAEAARFLTTLKQMVEQPITSLLYE